MVYRLLGSLSSLGIISIGILDSNVLNAKPTEYVFSAPQEYNQESVEIPSSKKEYPLYECNMEANSNSEEVFIDSHNCAECVDCREQDRVGEDPSKNQQLNSENKHNR
ncbi:hypothetical protein NIES4102_37120 [Chondrocystis sp. NIES-4102]|nr:hypothetical protein NIES4102_37120 [Chondrocystis sp. NIES-4102]